MSGTIAPREPTRHVTITATRLVRSAIEAALELDYPSVVVGAAGSGKTTAVRDYIKRDGGVYCQAGLANKSVRGMFQMLVEAHDIYSNARHTAELAQVVYSRLQPPTGRRGGLLIIDEFQTLEDSALREVLNIQETCKIPLVLCGNDKRLARTKSHNTALDQINSRLGIRVELGKPPAEDCRAIAVEFNVEGADAYRALETFGSATSLRDLTRVLEIAEMINPGGGIALAQIETAVIKQYGNPDALKLLTEGGS